MQQQGKRQATLRGSDSGSGSDSDGSSSGDAGAGGPSCPFPFTPDTPTTYLAKIKNILIGLPPTDQEVAAVTSGGDSALSTLVDTWMTGTQTASPGGPTYAELYQSKMLAFFQNAFQQTQIVTTDFWNQIRSRATSARTLLTSKPGGDVRPDSSGAERTGRPVQSVDVDEQVHDDDGAQGVLRLRGRLRPERSSIRVSPEPESSIPSPRPIQPERCTSPPPGPTIPAPCTSSTRRSSLRRASADLRLATRVCTPAFTLYGILEGQYPKDLNGCTAKGPGFYVASDNSDWTMVTISQPAKGTTAPPVPYYDLKNLRAGGANATQMVLNRPYVGFFTTPAFFANWLTNNSNQMRVTTNQSLIVALGKGLDGTDTTKPQVDPTQYGLDTTHATPGSPCITCHWLLDPTREIFANTFTWYYGYGPRAAEPDSTGPISRRTSCSRGCRRPCRA